MGLLKTGDKINGVWSIEEQIGKGSFGVVFRARHEVFDKVCAIKVLLLEHLDDDEVRARFINEGKALHKINSPHVIRVHEFGFWPPNKPRPEPFFAMDYLEGGDTLDRWRVQRDGLTWQQVARIAIQIGDGLAAAHDTRVAHRDLKPSNIYIVDAAEPRVILFDFGLAKTNHALLVRSFAGRLSKAQIAVETKGFVGTPAYVAPEQARGDKMTPASAQAADIYSLGAIMYELITRKPPIQFPAFDVDDEKKLFAEIAKTVTRTIPKPVRERTPSCPAWLADLIHRCLEKRIEDRPPSAREVALNLREGLENQAGSTKPATIIADVAVVETPSDREATRLWDGRGRPPIVVAVGARDRDPIAPRHRDSPDGDGLEAVVNRSPPVRPPIVPTPDARPAGFPEASNGGVSTKPPPRPDANKIEKNAPTDDESLGQQRTRVVRRRRRRRYVVLAVANVVLAVIVVSLALRACPSKPSGSQEPRKPEEPLNIGSKMVEPERPRPKPEPSKPRPKPRAEVVCYPGQQSDGSRCTGKPTSCPAGFAVFNDGCTNDPELMKRAPYAGVWKMGSYGFEISFDLVGRPTVNKISPTTTRPCKKATWRGDHLLVSWSLGEMEVDDEKLEVVVYNGKQFLLGTCDECTGDQFEKQ